MVLFWETPRVRPELDYQGSKNEKKKSSVNTYKFQPVNKCLSTTLYDIKYKIKNKHCFIFIENHND